MLETTDATFEHDVLQPGQIVLVDFTAAWCMPCQTMGPVLEKLAAARPDIKIVKIDIDKNQQTAANYAVRGIPNFVLFSDGKAIGNKTGALPGSKLSAWIDQTLQAQAMPVIDEPAPPELVATPENPADAAHQKKVEEAVASINQWWNRSKIISSNLQIAGAVGLAALGSPALLPLILGGVVATGQGVQLWQSQSQKKNPLWSHPVTQTGLGIATAAAGIMTFGAAGGVGTMASLGLGTLATVMTVSGLAKVVLYTVVAPILVSIAKKATEKMVSEDVETPAPQLALSTPAPKAPSPEPSPELQSDFTKAQDAQATGNTKAQEQTPKPPADGPSPKL